MDVIAPMIIMIVMTIATVIVIKVVGTNRRLDRMAKMHSEMQTRILDKFGSTQEMLDYLQTEPGQRLLDAPVVEQGSPYGRILGSVQAGIVLALVGVAFLAVTGLTEVPDLAGFIFCGVLGLALGVGFIGSAWAAHALSKSYGLINGHGRENGQ